MYLFAYLSVCLPACLPACLLLPAAACCCCCCSSLPAAAAFVLVAYYLHISHLSPEKPSTHLQGIGGAIVSSCRWRHSYKALIGDTGPGQGWT